MSCGDHFFLIGINQFEQEKPQQNGYIESFNGSLRDECLIEEIFDSLADARRVLELSEGSAHGALAQAQTDDYQML